MTPTVLEPESLAPVPDVESANVTLKDHQEQKLPPGLVESYKKVLAVLRDGADLKDDTYL